MRIFVAGATGVIGVRLLPLLVDAGHEVTGMTRTVAKASGIEATGASAVIRDVYDAAAVHDSVVAKRPEILINALSDLPDEIPSGGPSGRNARIRREGSGNLLRAAIAASVLRVVVFSVAWPLEGDEGRAVEEMERSVLDAGGVVVRCGRLYGPGTWYVDDLPQRPRVHADDAARRSIVAFDGPSRTIELIDEG
jgi:nucleoside-diphosphate-sugar epimerase